MQNFCPGFSNKISSAMLYIPEYLKHFSSSHLGYYHISLPPSLSCSIPLFLGLFFHNPLTLPLNPISGFARFDGTFDLQLCFFNSDYWLLQGHNQFSTTSKEWIPLLVHIVNRNYREAWKAWCETITWQSQVARLCFWWWDSKSIRTKEFVYLFSGLMSMFLFTFLQ